MNIIKKGDVVTLKSDRLKMDVEKVNSTSADCVWHHPETKQKLTGTFEFHNLERCETKEEKDKRFSLNENN